ncbi:hypothetical protein AB0I95_13975 [Micromonospora sp. NPDC049751]|uniref:hypothetical protein n=1 Tax=unclassified Micromonospora TaxID=2617518 RepID=UPI0033ED9AEA
MSSRAAMAEALTLNPASPTKTFVLEAHTDEPGAYLEDLAGQSNVEPTGDAYIYRLHTDNGSFWVDQLNPRFWSFHTDMRTDRASSTLNSWVGSRRDLDWIWLPSEHLRHIWPGARARRVRTDFRGRALLGGVGADTEDLRVQLSGRNAEALLDFISNSADFRSAVSFDGVETNLSDPDFGTVREAVNRMGKFAVSGNSFELHALFVSTVVDRYSHLVKLCEQKALAWQASGNEDGGGCVTGGPVVILFSKAIPDLPNFLETLFSSRAPFRLWGMPEVTSQGIAEVEAVDLHVGQRLRFDIGDVWMRVYLEQGGCGNTIARLVSNLQHRFDAALRLADPDLDEAVGQHLAPVAA